ncbi:nucleotidyltransferase family protein [Streptomyces albidus (ex Kaewkla and Franco 2022)]|uniref:nucleotidyltransferase family protein n=1 Tax=Streptomyces albidus (ex Kaewkla and Franco 2022) TaxID=722709 RepID=UPI0015EF3061|nr:nucleotidyltransferase family protein [Streptomyces albidus (ex Kaewkla and Franco 2022)]
MTEPYEPHGARESDVPGGPDDPPGHTPVVAGLLLAAGGGRRLGGRPKALLPLRGRPLVEHAVRALREGGCRHVHVVLGAAAEEVRARAELPGCVLLDNPDWETGMGSSLRLGLASLMDTGTEAALVSLVDQPGIGAEAVNRVRAACHSPASLAAAGYEGRRGHPVLFGAEHWPGVAASANGDQGARSYLRTRTSAIELVECGDVADPSDVDVPADLQFLDRLGS